MKDDVKPGPAQGPVQVGSLNIEAFANNLARLVEQGGKALAAYMKPREAGEMRAGMSDEVADVVKTLGEVAEYWLSDPQRAVELQRHLGKAYLELWGSAVRRMAGEEFAAGCGPRSEGPPLRRSGMVDQPVLRFHQAGLPAHHRMGGPPGAER